MVVYFFPFCVTFNYTSVYTMVFIQLYTYKYKCVIILTYLFNRLQLFKIFFVFFLDIHLYSDNLSTIAKISSLIMSELFPACFSYSSNSNLLHYSSGSNDKIIVFEIPEAMIAGNFSKFIIYLSLSLFHPFCLILIFISFPDS